MSFERTWTKLLGKISRAPRRWGWGEPDASYVSQRLVSDLRSYERLYPALEDAAQRRQFYEHLRAAKLALSPVMDVEGGQYERVGDQEADGGYVMLKWKLPEPSERIAYSIGICDDVTWDKDLAQRGYQVYMYDHTIEGLVESHPNFHFFKIGICGEPKVDKCQTLAEMVASNGHTQQKNMILKIDVEGAEHASFNACTPELLQQFSQIVVEWHRLTDYKDSKNILNAIQRLNQTHQATHIHGNNFSPTVGRVADIELPEVLEMTYLRRDLAHFIPSQRFFPTPLDRPCDKTLLDWELGYWT